MKRKRKKKEEEKEGFKETKEGGKVATFYIAHTLC
jgi:hypothetical protein